MCENLVPYQIVGFTHSHLQSAVDVGGELLAVPVQLLRRLGVGVDVDGHQQWPQFRTL